VARMSETKSKNFASLQAIKYLQQQHAYDWN